MLKSLVQHVSLNRRAIKENKSNTKSGYKIFTFYFRKHDSHVDDSSI